MHLQVMPGFSLSLIAAQRVAAGHPLGHLVVQRASLSIPDTLFLFVVALVVFGPKRLPEIGKQIGKLVFEFRRASNDFKLQIEEELRLSEQQERQKVLDMQATTPQPATPVAMSAKDAISAAAANEETPAAPDRTSANVDHDMPLSIQPPSSGLPVSALPPNHAANVMTSIPPASALPEEPTADTAPDNATAHHG